ncbi:hypothetical protein HOLleu_30208 [Holothuria leucospilota]|uniref:Alpha galactosidase C-terminal domain-containing protein n=1 Tax=Holothuria leucospilota TaxID=206669 RepID=A0A9Q1BK19_HOLLE|nr:hypothetical protein HOLleu_30208 [Holothuria leucospilota]
MLGCLKCLKYAFHWLLVSEVSMFQIDTSEVWVKKLGLYDEWAFVLLNRGPTNATVTLRLADIGLLYKPGYELRDLFKHTEIGHADSLEYRNYTVPATGAIMAYAYPSE